MSKCMPTFKFYDAVNKTAVIPLVSITQKSQDVQLELCHHHIEFNPDQMKNELENVANRSCFALTLWPPGKVKVNESGMVYKSMVPMSMANMTTNVAEKFVCKVCVQCPTSKFLPRMMAGQPAKQTRLTTYIIYMIPICLKKNWKFVKSQENSNQKNLHERWKVCSCNEIQCPEVRNCTKI